MLSLPCMTYAKTGLLGVAGAVLLAAGAACSSMGSLDGAATHAPGENPGTSSGGAPSSEGRGDLGDAPGAPTASGVVIVHAAAFPAFRLCFENMPELRPQPDSKIMPEANVVGVEVGSVVRIDPMKAPGTIYVMNERDVRLNDFTCGELLEDPSKKLILDSNYHVANVIDEPLGQGQVHVLAITGCGAKASLNYLKTTEADCDKGASKKWDATSGNLEARVIPLAPSRVGASMSTLPVQLIHLAPKLDAMVGTGALEVTFGDLREQGALPQQVATELPLLGTGSPVMLDVDQSDLSVYGTHGFRIAVRDQGVTKFEIDQSLAAIQDLSSPRDTPDSYYRTPSNYALLLLGDPTAPAALDGGAPVASRRQVQLLAIPVLDPSQVPQEGDAGDGDGGAP
jgi:hypothetical protein